MVKINMKKSDLKNGMIVETRDGDRYVVRSINDEMCLSGNTHWLDLTNGYTGDLKCCDDSDLDIVKVYKSKSYILGSSLFEDNKLILIWKRGDIFNDFKAKYFHLLCGDTVKIDINQPNADSFVSKDGNIFLESSSEFLEITFKEWNEIDKKVREIMSLKEELKGKK